MGEFYLVFRSPSLPPIHVSTLRFDLLNPNSCLNVYHSQGLVFGLKKPGRIVSQYGRYPFKYRNPISICNKNIEGLNLTQLQFHNSIVMYIHIIYINTSQSLFSLISVPGLKKILHLDLPITGCVNCGTHKRKTG